MPPDLSETAGSTPNPPALRRAGGAPRVALAPLARPLPPELIRELLSAIPEEEIWLASQHSIHTRRAYRQAVAHFLASFGIHGPEGLREVRRAHVVAWERGMKDAGAKPATVRLRLSALSSLFSHLVNVHAVRENPVREIRRPRINRKHGTTAAFSKDEARAILDAPDPESIRGVRDRAILSVGFQAGARRSEIAYMTVGSFHVNAGYPSLKFTRKGGDEHSLAIHPATAKRIEAYLAASGHGEDPASPLFLPTRRTERHQSLTRHLHPDMIDRILRKYVLDVLAKTRGYSAHSMRATFITQALENGAALEDVQEAVGHADPATTKLYDRRGYNPEKAAAFFANY